MGFVAVSRKEWVWEWRGLERAVEECEFRSKSGIDPY